MKGFGLRKGGLVQQWFGRRLPPWDQKKVMGCEARCTQCIVELGISIWKHRNEVVHGRSVADNRAKAREAVLGRICMVQKPTNHLMQWL